MSIREALLSDIPEIKELFRGTVLTVNRKDYSQEEVEDWASCGDDDEHLKELIDSLYFVVAEDVQNRITGFASITEEGYLHALFIHKDFQGFGWATMLLEHIERYAVSRGISLITSEVSETARPFFEKKGYAVEREQRRKANRLCLKNYWMKKRL